MGINNHNALIIDQGTGEILKVIDWDTHYIRAKTQDEAYKRKQFAMKDNRHFSFADMQHIKEVISNISTVHCGYLLILQCFMEYRTGKLTLKRKEMPKAVGTSESTFIRFWNEVRSHGIVIEKKGEYYVNPRFHFRSEAKSDRVIKLFTTTLKQLRNDLKPAELGFLYKLLPYVHFETNMICADPFTAPEDIQFLNKSQIAELVEMEEKKTSKMLDKLRKSGVIAETIRGEDKRVRLFTLNPYVFYRRKGQPDDTLRNMFASTPYSPKK
jgi:hypothetical protein